MLSRVIAKDVGDVFLRHSVVAIYSSRWHSMQRGKKASYDAVRIVLVFSARSNTLHSVSVFYCYQPSEPCAEYGIFTRLNVHYVIKTIMIFQRIDRQC